MRHEGEDLTCAVTLKSLSPGMLLNPGQGNLLEHLFYGRPPKSGVGQSSMDVARERLLLNNRGEIIVPTRYVMATLINAGKQVPYARKAMLTTERDTWVSGLLDLLDSELALTDHDGSEVKWAPTKFPCWTESRQKHNDLVVRPRIKRWQLTVGVRFNQSMIGEEKVKKLFELAGLYVGLGDFRVGQNRRSRFGRFVVSGWESASGGPLALDAA